MRILCANGSTTKSTASELCLTSKQKEIGHVIIIGKYKHRQGFNPVEAALNYTDFYGISPWKARSWSHWYIRKKKKLQKKTSPLWLAPKTDRVGREGGVSVLQRNLVSRYLKTIKEATTLKKVTNEMTIFWLLRTWICQSLISSQLRSIGLTVSNRCKIPAVLVRHTRFSTTNDELLKV